MKAEQTHVIIIGCGPTGALLSALLTQFDVPHVVLERELSIVTDPRGIALDEDGIRILQGLGLYDKLYTVIGQTVQYLLFTNGKNGLHTTPFMRINLGTTEGATGHPGVICHKQPVMEAYIRAVAGGTDGKSIRLGTTLQSIEEGDAGVDATYIDTDGAIRRVSGKYLVGADGKTGYVRKMYLEPRGIVMESKPGSEYRETWVAANYKITFPTPQTHPDFPLWKVGYTPQQVYDAFFPTQFRFIGNPDRPAVCGTFGLRSDRLWRFEFVVQGDEDGTDMSSYENATAIIFPYLTHDGSKYGLSGKIPFPPDCIEVLRCRPFTFAARSCNKWSLGRVILAGDAAHVMPPFGGQGIASGFRDASGLAWRLALTHRSQQSYANTDLLEGWCAERKQQLDYSIASTVTNGDLCTTRNPIKIFFRDWLLWFMQQVPAWNRWLERGPRNEGVARYSWRKNMAFLPDFAGGVCLPQVYCRSLQSSVSPEKATVQFTDDVIFTRSKQGLFQLVVLADNVEEAETLLGSIDNTDLHSLSKGLLSEKEATCLVHDTEASLATSHGIQSAAAGRVYRIATGEEFSMSELCVGRPPPVGYDMYRVKKELKGASFAIVRPDRFVFAACRTVDELREACLRVNSVTAL